MVLRAIDLLGIESTALERVAGANLLSMVDDRIIFRHPLVRSSVYGAANPSERRAVHRALFEVLPELDLDRRAWHLAESVVGPDEQAAALLEQVAIRAASSSANAVAANAFERAARLSSDDASGVGRLVAAGEAAWLAGQPERARVLLDEALRGAAPAQLRVRAQELLGGIAARTGSLVDARDTLSAAAGEAEAFDADLAVTLLADAVNTCFYLGDAAWAMSVLDRIRRLLSGSSTARAQILGLIAIGTAELLAGRGGMRRFAGPSNCSPAPTNWTRIRAGWRCSFSRPMLLRESGTGRDLVRRVVEESGAGAPSGRCRRCCSMLARDEAATDRWAGGVIGIPRGDSAGQGNRAEHRTRCITGRPRLVGGSAGSGNGMRCAP